MTEVAFYHLTRSSLEQALAQLLHRTIDGGKRAVVITGSGERAEHLGGYLWTHDPASWLPHGTKTDGAPERQPVWITDTDENPNGASFLFLTEGAVSGRLGDFERCFEMFDGNDPEQLARAREKWKSYKEQGINPDYWQQGAGGWKKKEV